MMECVSLPLLLTVLLTGTSASPSSAGGQQAFACPPRWLLLGQRCFAFYPVWSSWSSAQSVCSQTGGDLASLHTPEERQFVLQLASKHTPVWLGGYQNVSWLWSDASAFRVASWTNQSLGKSGEGGACMQMDPKSAELQSAPCGELRFFICSTTASSGYSGGEPRDPGVAPSVSLMDVLWGHADLLAEEILRSSSFLQRLRSGRLSQRCYAGFLQQEALYLRRVSSTLEVLLAGLPESDASRPLLLETLRRYGGGNQSVLASSPPPPWLLSSLLSFHSVVLEPPPYWLVALSARARLRCFLVGALDAAGGTPPPEYQEWREESLQEVTWTQSYRKLLEAHQDQMDAFKAINIFREQMMNQKSFYKATDCDP